MQAVWQIAHIRDAGECAVITFRKGVDYLQQIIIRRAGVWHEARQSIFGQAKQPGRYHDVPAFFRSAYPEKISIFQAKRQGIGDLWDER
ncbi:hypothetical protein [Microbispora oryzae]|uniref:hypothetical protein n=1 Tax=Microbispora oryzae TaxID=2806554 RepID=UPI001E4B6153|nr:hypothetical protein [Microbispora oryzae]